MDVRFYKHGVLDNRGRQVLSSKEQSLERSKWAIFEMRR